jgi:PemK-like, MazF-like toxin of type II toxin-antitoxin system
VAGYPYARRVTDQRPERGGAWDFRGTVHPEYAPNHDGSPDPGEVVWAWVPYEEDPSQGKDRPLIIIGRAEGDASTLVGLMLSSREHDGDEQWHRIGSGAWDRSGRPSWARCDRPLAVTARAVRREGSAIAPGVFLALVEHSVGLRQQGRISWPAGGPRTRRVTRLIGVYRARTGPLGVIVHSVGRLVGRGPRDLPGAHRSRARRTAGWDALTATIPVPFDLVHVSDLSGRLQAAVPSRDAAPVVLAEVGGRLEVVLGPRDIEPLGGSVVAFQQALARALDRRGLSLR